MIKYFILIGIILVMSLLPRIESMNVLQQFKTKHKNLLNQITNIRNTENILYNNIYKFPNKKQDIIDEINRLALKRDQLFKSIQDQTTLFKTITPKITQEEKLVKEIESELSQFKYKKQPTDNIINNKRMIKINEYYNARSLSYISLFKTIVLFFIPLLIIALLVKYNIFPSTLGQILMIIILIITIIYSFNQYMDILSRDNMNFNEYDFDNTTDNNLDDLGKVSKETSKMCIDQACCAKGTIYDKDLGQCRLPIR
jgi:hypothetical protein